MLSAAAIQFKGSGWYVTDYAKKSGSPASGEKSGDGSTSSSPKSPAKQNPRIQRAAIRSPEILSQVSRARANPNRRNRSQAAQKALLRREVKRKSRTNRNL